MAATFNSAIAPTQFTSTTSVVSSSITTVAGMVYLLEIATTGSVTTITPSNSLGISWRQVAPQVQCGTNAYVALFVGSCSAGATGTFSISLSSSSTGTYGLTSVLGVDANGPIGKASTVPTTGSPTISLTNLQPNSVVYSVWAAYATASTTLAGKAGSTVINGPSSIDAGNLGKLLSQYVLVADALPSVTVGGTSATGGGIAVELITNPTQFLQKDINGGAVPVYDVGRNMVSKNYLISAYHSMNPTVKAPQLWAFGDNNVGQIGNGSAGVGITSSSPVQIGSLINWKYVAAGGNSGGGSSLSVKTDGTLWSWGRNLQGVLMQSNTTSLSSPVQVGALTNWKYVACGYAHAGAIKTDGTLWMCGYNSGPAAGAVGNGGTTSISSPVQVSGLWKHIACGYYSTAGIKTDGTLWTWGQGADGQLGSGSTIGRSTPVQVTGALWKYVTFGGEDAHSNVAGIRNDGTLWTWGYGANGRLGQNNTTTYSSPVQVAGSWKHVAMGASHTAAIKTDGTLWTWGSNNTGQLGIGSTAITSYSSPVQVGSMSNWKYVACTGQSIQGTTIAVKSDGSLWVWGDGGKGQTGSANTYSSPVQIGSAYGWKYIAGGFDARHWLAIAEGAGW